MDYKKITVAGSGVLGSQIAYQTAFKGFDVVIYDINEEAIEKSKQRLAKLMKNYRKDFGSSEAEVEAAYGGWSFKTNMVDALYDAYWLIESSHEVTDCRT